LLGSYFLKVFEKNLCEGAVGHFRKSSNNRVALNCSGQAEHSMPMSKHEAAPCSKPQDQVYLLSVLNRLINVLDTWHIDHRTCLFVELALLQWRFAVFCL